MRAAHGAVKHKKCLWHIIYLEVQIAFAHHAAMCNLQEYLNQNSITQRAFAERIGVGQGTVCRLTKKQITPTLRLALRIEKETGGKVPVQSWAESEGAA